MSRGARPARERFPLRRVLPWWFVAGAIVTFVTLEALPGANGTLTSVFWVPVIVSVVRDRRLLAEAAMERGESPGGRPAWLEPVARRR